MAVLAWPSRKLWPRHGKLSTLEEGLVRDFSHFIDQRENSPDCSIIDVDTIPQGATLIGMSLAASASETTRSASLSSVVTHEIERMVLTGELKPGERINEQQLAQRFGVSRGPIREAVRGLEGAGLARAVPNRGVFVRRLSVTEVRELYDIRAALFGLAGRLMAERATPGEVARLEDMLAAMERAAERRDFDAYYPLNLAFHGMIVDGSGSGTLAAQYRSFVKALNLFRARSLVQGGGLAVSNREHREMVRAIAARDPTWAQEAHWRHVASAKDRLLAVVRAEERDSDSRTTGAAMGGYGNVDAT
jgi:DNA-binding GntR family transcriptional regulator